MTLPLSVYTLALAFQLLQGLEITDSGSTVRAGMQLSKHGCLSLSLIGGGHSNMTSTGLIERYGSGNPG